MPASNPNLVTSPRERMRRMAGFGVVVTVLAALAACSSRETGTLQTAAAALGVNELKSIEFSGTGYWYQFGQAPAPTLPWPQFDVSGYTATINYENPAARVQIARTQALEAGRTRPAPVEQKVDQYVSGVHAWNLAIPANAQPGTTPVPAPQPAAFAERTAEIWATPHGFLKAALANGTATKLPDGGSEVSFILGGKYRYEGTINANDQVESVRTWIDNPVLGDTLVETRYSDYRDYGGVRFPGRIVRTQGDHPILDITVTTVQSNPPVEIPVPESVTGSPTAQVSVNVARLAPGVFYFTGGTHHSLVVEQNDHVIVVEAPQNEARSLAVIAKVKETIPSKPIKYLINTHAHFDHAGGLRTYVDEGATIVTHAVNNAYYEQAWAAPRTINPDRLAQSNKAVNFETFTDKHVLTDGRRSIEIHPIAGSGHNDAFALVYLPAEKILIEADAYTPTAKDASLPAVPNPYSVNLYENIQKLKLDVRQIAALHGPRVATLADLRAAIGQKAN